MKRTIKLVLEYDGTGFAGWQVQPGQRTVQNEIEKALETLTGKRTPVEASGRTDAGVHALGQVASFITESSHEPRVFRRGLNALLPADVAVLSAAEAAAGFHARRSARGKWYRYLLLDRTEKSALMKNRAWILGHGLDLEAMRRAASHLVGARDFQSFRSSTCEAKNSVREMRRIEIYRSTEGIRVELWANAFLKQMARAIVGTLVETGSGKREPDDMRKILAARDRGAAGVTAPPQGLYLLRVDYDDQGGPP